MKLFDFAVAYKWIYDTEFTQLIEKRFQAAGLSTFVISAFNIAEVTGLVKRRQLGFRAFLDRASDEDQSFSELAKLLSNSDAYIINRYELIDKAVDKANMHGELTKYGFKLPRTIIAPAFNKDKNFKLSKMEYDTIGSPFIVKPAYYSGGGESVKIDVSTAEGIQKARMEIPEDRFLIQEKICPWEDPQRRIWLRCYWFLYEAVPVWWDDITHIYSDIKREDLKKFKLQRIIDITKKLSSITGLDYFSTEGTIDKNGELILIDYVNDQCDMRLKSKHLTGVPDNIVEKFIANMIRKVSSLKKSSRLQ